MAVLQITNLMFLLVVVLLTVDLTRFTLADPVSFINLKDKGYNGIRIALTEKVPEDPELISNLERFFSRASEILYIATRGEAYFKEIIITVPITWELKEKDFITSSIENILHMSDIRIDVPHPIYGDHPFTVHTGHCGESGDHIHFSANLFKNLANLDEGFIARQIVNHWARYRYGVFEEHLDPFNPLMYPPFYMKDGKIFPSTCVANIPGWAVSKTHKKCTISQGKLIDDCMFSIDVKKVENITASLMSYFCLPTVDHFCDYTAERMHNRFAPTKQNVMCNFRSTLDVISSHLDFRHITKWSDKVPSQGSPPKPNFIWKKTIELKGRFIVVLDRSGSMKQESRIDILKAVTMRFFKDLLPTGSYVGVVIFNENAKVHIYMNEVNDDFRENKINLIKRMLAYGATAIGKGLKTALTLLKDAEQETEGAAIILISDGEETEGTLTEELYEEIQESGVIIHPIGFGSEASDKLEYLATLTGGKTYYYDTSQSSKVSAGAMDVALLEIIKTQMHLKNQPVLVYKVQEDFIERETFYKFVIDKELGKDTVISIILNLEIRPYILQVEVQSPLGQNYDKTNSDDRAGRIICSIDDADQGEWKIIIKKAYDARMNIFVMVFSHHRLVTDLDLISITGWLSRLEVDPSNFNMSNSLKQPLRIFVKMQKGHSSIVNATVTSMVKMPDGKAYQFRLLDNGGGADVMKYDGVYSAYFIDYPGDGRYPVSIQVINDGQAKVRLWTMRSMSLSEACNPVWNLQTPSSPTFDLSEFWIKNETALNDTMAFVHTEKLDPFQRFLEVGSFKVVNWTANYKQKIPPGRVTDLKVTATLLTNDSLVATLTWTAPGAYLDQGTPSFIEFRGHNTVAGLIGVNFTNAILFGFPKGVKSPLTDPDPAGTKVTLIVNISLNNVLELNVSFGDYQEGIIYEYSFALRAHNNEGLVGEISNIATAHFTQIWNTKIHVIDKPKPPKDEWPVSVWYVVITIVMTVIVGITTHKCKPCCPCICVCFGPGSKDEEKKKKKVIKVEIDMDESETMN